MLSALLYNPGVALGLLLSVGYAALFHLWRGQSLRELWVFLLVAPVGFGVGQASGFLIQSGLGQIGQLYVLEATIGAWLALIVAKAGMSIPQNSGTQSTSSQSILSRRSAG